MKILIIVCLLGFATLSQAATLTMEDFSAVASDNMKAIIQTFALGADYKAVHFATPEGVLFGLDVGLEVTAIEVPNKFIHALALMGNKNGDMPPYLPIPRLNITKGLPFGIDLGASIIKVKVSGIEFLNYGGSVKYALLDGGVTSPSIAIRGTADRGKYFGRVTTSTYGVEALISKSIVFIEPYAGIGYQYGKGEIDAGTLPIPVDVKMKHTVTQYRPFVGAALKLFALHLTAQADFGSEVKTYSGKLSLNF